jgi:Protein of unknown function (DUF2924)
MAAPKTLIGADSMQLAIERLWTLDGETLRLEWRNLFGKRAPKALPRSLLVRALAYRLQALEFGDLDPQTLRVLNAYAGKGGGKSRGRVRVDRLCGGPTSSRHIKPGSILVREWSGELHRVMALEGGFAWNSGTYRSLSEVARAITGARWNGPRFFGLGRGNGASQDAARTPTKSRRGGGKTRSEGEKHNLVDCPASPADEIGNRLVEIAP